MPRAISNQGGLVGNSTLPQNLLELLDACVGTFQLVDSPSTLACRANSMASRKAPGFLTHQKNSFLSSLPTNRTTFSQPQARRASMISDKSIS